MPNNSSIAATCRDAQTLFGKKNYVACEERLKVALELAEKEKTNAIDGPYTQSLPLRIANNLKLVQHIINSTASGSVSSPSSIAADLIPPLYSNHLYQNVQVMHFNFAFSLYRLSDYKGSALHLEKFNKESNPFTGGGGGGGGGKGMELLICLLQFEVYISLRNIPETRKVINQLEVILLQSLNTNELNDSLKPYLNLRKLVVSIFRIRLLLLLDPAGKLEMERIPLISCNDGSSSASSSSSSSSTSTTSSLLLQSLNAFITSYNLLNLYRTDPIQYTRSLGSFKEYISLSSIHSFLFYYYLAKFNHDLGRFNARNVFISNALTSTSASIKESDDLIPSLYINEISSLKNPS